MSRQIIEKIRCDCCGKEQTAEKVTEVKMPIIMHSYSADGEKTSGMSVKEMDFCERCAEQFTRLYYKIAEENNFSGIIGIVEEKAE